MFAFQWKRSEVMVKLWSIGIDTIVAGQTVRAERLLVLLAEGGIDLLVAVPADCLIELGHSGWVAIGTSKPGAVGIPAVSIQGIAHLFVREI